MVLNNYNSITMTNNNTKIDLDKDFDPNLLDSKYWHPKCSNFEIIDWEKWNNLDIKPPKVYNPPQNKSLSGCINAPMWWYNRSWLCQPLPCLFKSCSGCGFACTRPEMEMISTDELMQKMLRSNEYSEYIPEPLRNKLIWTEENIAPETLISVNRWAWRSQSDAGRAIGLGSTRYDWSHNPSCFGHVIAWRLHDRYLNVQVSPDGKWIALAGFNDPSPQGKVVWIFMYVVQDGDEFLTPDHKVIDNIRPGDILRLTWDTTNPYNCNNDELKYSYFFRTVAEVDPVTWVITRNEQNYQRLLQKATNDPEKCCRTCGYACACCMSAQERFDFQVSNLSDEQWFEISPEPPSPQILDRL